MLPIVPETGPQPADGSDAGSRYLWPALIIVGVLVANFPPLVGITDVNPLVTYAGLLKSRAPQLVPGVSTIDVNVGATSQALGHRAALDWLHGHVPWWNPFEGVGTPLAAGMQAAVFFPPTLLLAWSDGQLAFRLLLEAATGIFTYLLIRRLGLHSYVAAAAGLVFALDGTYAWFQHAAINPLALLPAAILGVEVACDRPLGDWRTLLLPAAIALSITAGFPETAFFDDLLVVTWALWRCACQPSNRDRLRLAGRMSLLGAGGVLIAAPLILAFRSYLSQGNVGAHSGMAHVHLPAGGLLTLIDPYITGPLKAFVPVGNATISNLFRTNSGYLLVSGLVLALAGLALSRRETGLRFVLALWVLLITARNYGVGPVEQLFAHIPYVDESAVFRSAVPSVEFVVVVLAAFGIEAMLERGSALSRARRWHLAAISGIVGAGLLALAYGPSHQIFDLVLHGGPYPADPRPYVYGAAVATGVILAGLAVSGALPRRFAAIGLCAVFVLEAGASFVYPELAATRDPVVDMKPVAWLQAHLGSERFYSLYSNPAVGPSYGGPIAPNYGSYFGLSSADYLDIPDPQLFVNYVHDHLDPGAGSEFFGTVFARVPGAPDGLVELGRNYRAFESIGVGYIVTGARVRLATYVPSARRVFDDGYAAIWKLPRAASYYSTLQGRCSLRGSGANKVTASCAEPAVVQRLELALPGWSATVNGRPAKLIATHDSVFSAVAVPAGVSTIVWSYRPGHLRLGEVLLVLGLAMLAAPFAWRWRRSRRSRLPAEPPTPEAAS